MKKLCFLFNILLGALAISTSSFSQVPTIQWQKSLGGTYQDQAFSIQQTLDSGYVVVGSTTSNNDDVSGAHGMTDYWVVKLNNSGTIQWQECLGSSGFDIAYTAKSTRDGGCIVAGSASANSGNVIGNHGGDDFWLVKLHPSGSIEWQKSLGGSSNDDAYAVEQTSDNGYIIAGSTLSSNGDVAANHGGWDYWVVKTDDTGAIQWQKSLGGSRDDRAYAIKQTNDGGYIVVGYSFSHDGQVYGHRGNTIDSLGLTSDFWIVKLNDTGAIQWSESLGGSGDEIAYSVQQVLDGGYVIAGYSSSNDSDVSGNRGNRDYWVVKLSNGGAIQWQRSLGGSHEEQGKSIIETSAGQYLVAGYSLSNDSDVIGSHGDGISGQWR
jgi:hypothetical protein